MPKRTKTSAKRGAKASFNRFIRIRDCIRTSGWPDQGSCVTCGKFFPFEDLDGGHFVKAGNHAATLFDEQNCTAQCRRCNRFEDGRQYEHGKAIDKIYGEGTADAIVERSKKEVIRTIEDYDAIKKKYKDKADELQ